MPYNTMNRGRRHVHYKIRKANKQQFERGISKIQAVNCQNNSMLFCVDVKQPLKPPILLVLHFGWLFLKFLFAETQGAFIRSARF